MTVESKIIRNSFLKKLFLSPSPVRLRAGWRLIIHTMLMIFLSIPIGVILFIPIGLSGITFDSPLALLANELTMLIAITAATFLARRFLDKLSIVSLGLLINSQSGRDILVGLFIPFFQIGLIYLIEIAMGWTNFDRFAWQAQTIPVVAAGLGQWFLIFLIVGWQEELLSRGYHLQTIRSGLNLVSAVLISSSIFAFLHILNPGASWISTLGIFLAGLFLALPYILTRQLWLSIGLHIGWNFFEGVIYGFPVSGLNTFRLLHHTVSGPDIWTGGVFGPEAGLLIIPALFLGVVLVLIYTNLRTFLPTQE